MSSSPFHSSYGGYEGFLDGFLGRRPPFRSPRSSGALIGEFSDFRVSLGFRMEQRIPAFGYLRIKYSSFHGSNSGVLYWLDDLAKLKTSQPESL
ncbi:hypothetical protein ABZP36_007783 [Zizania latifolia]